MGKLAVTFLGSGDAFGTGGRLQACILVKSPTESFLLDCGATVMTSLRRYGIDPNSVERILLSHLHGDHFGGIPFFILDAQLISKRTQPLTIVGPVGTQERVLALMEVMFPGSSTVQRKFAVEFVELTPDRPQQLEGLTITACRVPHIPVGDALALRVELNAKSIAYTGDGEWTDDLIPLCRQADLVIVEGYSEERSIKNHMNLRIFFEHWPAMAGKRLILTHMSREVLQKSGEMDWECAADGETFELE